MTGADRLWVVQQLVREETVVEAATEEEAKLLAVDVPAQEWTFIEVVERTAWEETS